MTPDPASPADPQSLESLRERLLTVVDREMALVEFSSLRVSDAEVIRAHADFIAAALSQPPAEGTPKWKSGPTEDEINRLEKAAWDANVDHVLVWYRDQSDHLRDRLREADRALKLERQRAIRAETAIGKAAEGTPTGEDDSSLQRYSRPSGTAEPEASALSPANATEAERAAVLKMWEAHEELRRLGWRDAIYCPKDGSAFWSIEPGSTGIHDTYYEGEWPNGHWWVAEANDLWPSRPCLFKEK